MNDYFYQAVNNRILFLDGATGSNLMKRGMPSGCCPEAWILENPDVLIELQREYIEAGSNIVYAPTFTANRIKLKEYGLDQNIKEINYQLVAITKEAVGELPVWIAGDITMTGQQLAPIGTMDFEELIDVYREQMTYLVEAGVNLFVIETMISLQECRAAVIAAKEVCDLPIMVSMTFEENGKSLFGTPAVVAATVLERLGVTVFGANCSTGPKAMAPMIAEVVRNSHIPILAKPNAGMPKYLEDGTTGYDMEADTFAKEMEEMVKAGATVLGGCCGTTPSHIELLCNSVKYKENISDKQIISPEKQERESFINKEHIIITSERVMVEVCESIAIDNHINTLINEELLLDLQEGYFDLIMDFVEEYEDDDVDCFNVCLEGDMLDVASCMLQAIDEIASVTNKPLSFTVKDIEILEKVLRKYPGTALVNMTDYVEEALEKGYAVCKQYGAFPYQLQKENIADNLLTIGKNNIMKLELK